jgi:hypothetical protein
MHELSHDNHSVLRRRQIFYIAGYEVLRMVVHYDRLGRQLEIFKRTWDISAVASAAQERECGLSWSIDASGPNWQTRADYEVWGWDDIVRADAAISSPRRLWNAAVAYFDFLFTGTIFRYVKANAPYFLFTVVPPLEIVLFAAIAVLAGYGLAQALGLDGAMRVSVIVAVGLAGFFLLLRWPGRRWQVEQALDDWIFSRAYIRGRRPDLDARLEAFAGRLIACARKGAADEIVVVGHSLGATLAIDVVARALARDPDLGRRGVAINILTVGATIPKCALHPAGTRIRQAIAKVVAEPSIHWTEIHTRGDPISFYRFDPASLRRIDRDRVDRKPAIRRVQIHDMLLPESYKRIRMRVLRMHYQVVSANDRLCSYDYFMMACGPIPFGVWTVSPQGLLDFLGRDGGVNSRQPSAVVS